MRTIFSIIICFSLQIKVKNFQQEQCIQNVCTPFPLLRENDIFHYAERVENHILNNYRFFTPSHSHTVTGNGVYRMCVHRSCCYMRNIFSIMIGFPLQIIVIQLQEQCKQNVCTPFLLLHEKHIFNNDRFSTPNHSHPVTGTV